MEQAPSNASCYEHYSQLSAPLLALVWLNSWGQNQYNLNWPKTVQDVCTKHRPTFRPVLCRLGPQDFRIPVNLNLLTRGRKLATPEDRTLLTVISLTWGHCRDCKDRDPSTATLLFFLSISKTQRHGFNLVGRESLHFANRLCLQWLDSPSQLSVLKFCSFFKPQVKYCLLCRTFLGFPGWN